MEKVCLLSGVFLKYFFFLTKHNLVDEAFSIYCVNISYDCYMILPASKEEKQRERENVDYEIIKKSPVFKAQ